MFLRLYLAYALLDFERAETYILHAREYINSAVENLFDEFENFGFLSGNAGVYAVAAVIYQITDLDEKTTPTMLLSVGIEYKPCHD